MCDVFKIEYKLHKLLTLKNCVTLGIRTLNPLLFSRCQFCRQEGEVLMCFLEKKREREREKRTPLLTTKLTTRKSRDARIQLVERHNFLSVYQRAEFLFNLKFSTHLILLLNTIYETRHFNYLRLKINKLNHLVRVDL